MPSSPRIALPHCRFYHLKCQQIALRVAAPKAVGGVAHWLDRIESCDVLAVRKRGEPVRKRQTHVASHAGIAADALRGRQHRTAQA